MANNNNTMENDADLPTLIANQDHLNVLRYIRVHELREPELVVHHGLLLLGGSNDKNNKLLLDKKKKLFNNNLARLAALEQVCLAALDLQQLDLAKTCLNRLAGEVVPGVNEKESVRFRHLTARCLEAAQDYAGAELMYQELIQENPSNLVALKRLYCIARAQAVDSTVTSMEDACNALHHYLEFNYADTSAWYELARLRMEMGDFKSAAFGLEEVILAMPADADMHVALAECYSTLAATASSSTSASTTTTTTSSLSDLEYCILARKHMAQALELDITNRRALFGLIVTSNDYLIFASQVSSKSKKQLAAAASASASSAAADDDDDGKNSSAASGSIHDHEQLVAKELVKFGAEHLLQSYNMGTTTTSSMFTAVQSLLSEYTEGL